MKKWQLGVIVVALLGVFYAMNVVTALQQEKAEKLRKAAELAKVTAEQKAAAAKGATGPKPKKGPAVFALPKPLGPATAPIKIQALVDTSNSCHAAVLPLKNMATIYGSKVRLEFLDMRDAKIADMADKVSLGCDSGLVINGKVEMLVNTPLGKKLVRFSGPPDSDKFRSADVYAAVNTLLAAKGMKVPAAGTKAATGAGMSPGTPKH